MQVLGHLSMVQDNMMSLIVITMLGIIAYFLRDLHSEIRRMGVRQDTVNDRLIRLEESGKADWRAMRRELETHDQRLNRLETFPNQNNQPVYKPQVTRKNRNNRPEAEA